MCVWEILIPTIVNNRPVHTRFHRVWDARVRAISGGLTIMPPAQGQWVSSNRLLEERMIPVRIACTREQINSIADMTAAYYSQSAVMFYRISDEVVIKHYALS